jgi:trehalose synthase-fused probable maltokinase
MTQRRWFAAKSRVRSGISMIDLAPIPAAAPGTTYLCALQVDYVEGESEVYNVPLTLVEPEESRQLSAQRPEAVIFYLTDGRAVVDALSHEPSMLAITRTMAARRSSRALVPEPFPELLAAAKELGSAPARPLGVEQSNSSIVIGENVLVKVMRRLQAGENPDLEISRHLRGAGFTGGARLLGALTWRADGAPATLATAYEYVPSDGDAWAHALRTIDLFLDWTTTEDAPTHPPAAPALFGGLGEDQFSALGMAGPEMCLLGQRTAELHLALAQGHEPAFAPEPFSAHYQRSLYQGLRTEMQASLRQLRRSRSQLDPSLHPMADLVLAGRDRLLAVAAQVSAMPIEALRIRTHGDFHLGQVLFTGRDFVIIDFEGEPQATLSERRIKRTPLRDVAGMLRSLDYAAQVALAERQARGLLAPDDDHAHVWARWWRDAAAASFVTGYQATPGIGRLLPTEPRATDALLDAMVLEKALYELRYELDMRPDWVHLPLRVLAEAAAG